MFPAEYEILPIPMRNEADFAENEPIGIYLLNEGNMGSNKASIDYLDFCNGYYVRSIYTAQNPNVIKELGDVGNDIQIYGNRLYAVLNCSHKIEVMDSKTCKRLGQIDIPNCRNIRFSESKAYVSSYVGPVGIDPSAQLGAIYEIDTATLNITRKVTVGYQPDEFVITGQTLLVANSGGYRTPNYDNTVSVVDMANFKQVKKIEVMLNPNRMKMDKYGQIWVASRGNYKDSPSNIVVLSPTNNNDFKVVDTLPISCSDMYIVGDSLYFYGVYWNTQNEGNSINYGIIDIKTHELISDRLIVDGTENEIKVPYGIIVNPYNGDIYITDAKNYVSSGVLHCYDKNGHKKWSVRTGDIPAHMAFVYR